MWELLLSADYMVPDPDVMAETLSKALGLPPEKPGYRQDFENHHYIAHFLRVHPSLAVAPTRLEPQGHVDKEAPPSDPIFGDFLDSLAEFQGRHRPIKAHSNVLVTSGMDGLIELLMRRRVPFRTAPWSEDLPFDRLWIGATADQPRYRPDWDGGLMIEVIPVQPLRIPDAAYADPPEQPRDPGEGEMVRIVNRGYLVRDLDRTLAQISANLDLEPSTPVSLHEDEGYRRARVRFGIRNSATLDLVQPTRGDTSLGRYLNTWGPGPHYARIAVNGLGAKAEDLASRDVGFDTIEATSACPRRLAVHAADVRGAEIEFVETAEA